MTIYFNENKEAMFAYKTPPEGCAVIDDDLWHIYSATELGVDYDIVDGQFVQLTSIEDIKAREDAQVEIRQLKQKLADSDYQAIKFAEGQLTEEEYAPIREQREAWRVRIRELTNASAD